jgi:hypothetical protein
MLVLGFLLRFFLYFRIISGGVALTEEDIEVDDISEPMT